MSSEVAVQCVAYKTDKNMRPDRFFVFFFNLACLSVARNGIIMPLNSAYKGQQGGEER